MESDTDLMLTLGIAFAVVSVPSLLSAWVESRMPRIGLLLLIVAFGLIAVALTTKPGGYAFNQVPSVVVDVVLRLFN